MRILLVCDAMSVGGTEILTAHLANELRARGNDVSLFILPVPGVSDFGALKLMDKNIKHWVFERKRKADASILCAIRKTYKKINPDIILCQALFSLYCIVLATMFLKKGRIFLALHYTRNVRWKDEIFDWLYFTFIRFLKIEFIAIYRRQIDIFTGKYHLDRERFHIIHNGIDTNHFSGSVRKISDGRLNILHVANMRNEKDEKTLIRSFGIFNGEYDNWHAILCGKDLIGIKLRLVELLQKDNILDKVSFIDYEADIRELLRGADVFVLSSLSEALPIAALEAMSMGVPCILTEVGGCSDIVDDGVNGFLVPPSCPEAIAEKLTLLASDRDMINAMGKSARKRVDQEFNINKMVAGYLELFQGGTT